MCQPRPFTVHSWPANRECIREIASLRRSLWEEVYLHQYQTFEEAAAVPADVSGGCVQCQTSPLVFGLPGHLLSLSCNTRCVNVLVVCTFWGHSMPYAVKYAVSPPITREEVCGQARRQARSEENAQAHSLYPNDRGLFISRLRATALACDAYHSQPFSIRPGKLVRPEIEMLAP